MATRQVFESLNGDEFLQKLMESPMITIMYTADNDCPAMLSLPKALVCDVSSGLRHLCDQARDRAFAIDEVLGEPQFNFTARLKMPNGLLKHVLACFTKWLYSGIADSKHRQFDLWYFGQRIGSPRFQNAILREWCSRNITASPDAGLMVDFKLDDIDTAWNFACAAHEKQQKLGDRFKVDLQEQKLLMFFLDSLVYRGLDDPEIEELLCTGGPLTLQLAKRIAAAPRAGELHHPPWHPDNFDKYLVDESPDDLADSEEISETSS